MCVCMCVSANLCFDWISSAALMVTLWWHKLWKLIWLNRDVEQLHEQQCRQGIRWIPIVMLISAIILTCDCPCQIYDQQGVDQDKVLTPEALGSGSSSINMVHCTHCGIVHYTVWTIQRNLNLVFKSQHGKKWMIFFCKYQLHCSKSKSLQVVVDPFRHRILWQQTVWFSRRPERALW